ncbi:TldD/PmbA family protein [Candidatus Fermentibacteria bacterium]|nr:TldD/PmbA family protein [Candidatus Fermentibacteria bacterium]
MIPKDVSWCARLFQEHTEFRMQENSEIGVALLKGNVVQNSRSSSSGVSARVYKNGSWGFASYPETSDEAAADVVQAATENARFMARATGRSAPDLPPAVASHQWDFSTQKPRLDQQALVDFASTVDAFVAASYPALTSRRVALRCLDMIKSLVTSDGSVSFSFVPRTLISVSLSAETSSGPVDVFDVWGGLGQFEDVFASPEDLHEPLEQLHDHLMAKREAVYAQAGSARCVLAADLAGMLAHEAIGHTVEADFVMGGSVARDYLGAQVASPLINLIDYAHTAQGSPCPVPVFVDDEGVEAHDTVIIQDGVLKSYLHNRETALRFEVPPTGNARAFRFSDEPLIRMRNTAIVPGESSLGEMIAAIDDGYYLLRSGNGQADSTSEFMFGITIGYEIKGGKVGRAIRDTTISGVAFDLLKTVTMVSNTMVWSVGGMCGKKQSIPVSLGGPAVACTVTIGGR